MNVVRLVIITVLLGLLGASPGLAGTQVFDVVKNFSNAPQGNPHNSYPYDMWVDEADAGAYNGGFLWANQQVSGMHLWGVGTGLALRVVQQGNTRQISWKIDGGSGGSGIIDTNFDTGDRPGVRYTTYVLAATGTLSSGFHIIEVDTNNSLGLNETIILDALEVYDGVPTTLIDQVNWYYIGGPATWAVSDNTLESDKYAYGGSICYTLGAGAACQASFNGTGVMLIMSSRWDWDTKIDWSIDGGLASGTLLPPHTRLGGASTNFRAPVVLAQGLPYGAHTLTLTNGGGGTGWDLIILDALQVINNAPPKTRYEVTKSPADNKMGFIHWNKWYQEGNAEASAGNQVYAFDYPVESATQTMTFLFCGTGVDLGIWRYGNGEFIGWSIDDGAYAGSYDSWWWLAAPPAQGDRPILPLSGPVSLSSGLHKVEVTNLNRSAAQIIVLDFFEVYNDGWAGVTEVENTDPALAYTGSWVVADPEPNSSGGSRATTSDPAATLSLTFNGTSVAVVGWKQDICTTYNWSIDNGAGGSGVIDQFDSVDASVRPVDFIVNGLTDGPHTLTISHGGGSGYIEIDYIAVKGTTSTPVMDWALY